MIEFINWRKKKDNIWGKNLLKKNPYIGKVNVPDINKRNFIKKGILGLAAGAGIAVLSKTAKARYIFADATSLTTGTPDAAALIESIMKGFGTAYEIHQVDISSDGWTQQSTSGTGSLGFTSARQMNVQTGTTTGSFGFVSWASTRPGWSTGGASNKVLDWDFPIIFALTISRAAGGTAGTSHMYFGRENGNGALDADDKAIGFKVADATLSGHAHNGSSLTTDDLSTTLTDNIPVTVVVTSDGSGNVEWFVNGVSQGTTSSGPIGNSTDNHNQILLGSHNNAGTTNQGLHVHSAYIAVGH